MILFLFFAGLLFAPAVAFAHGTVWAAQYPDWKEGIQWGVIAGLLGVFAAGYLILKIILKRLQKVDLLDYGNLRPFMKSRYYPAIFQIPALIIFAVIAYYLFFGSYYFSQNPGSIFIWTLWWAILPFTFILVGRVWCAICPFAWISDFVQKHFGKQRRVPVWLVKYSFWIVDGTFLFVTWFDRVFGMTERPFVTGLVFLGLFIGVTACGILYERRVFCRYVCFLGNVAGTYSMASPLEFKSKNPEICADCKEKYCFFGRKDANTYGGRSGCPFYQIMPSKDGNRFCTLCANCVKACPNDNIALSLRPFGSDFWRRLYVRFEESFFAKMLVGIVILQNIGMLTLWGTLSDFIKNQTGITNETVLFTVVFFLTVSIPLLLMFLASIASSQAGKEKVLQNFARFGYAFVAVDLAGHLAHNLNHFFGEGKTILAALAGIFSGNVQQMIFTWFLNFGTVRVLQYIILALGTVATIAITYRIALKSAQTKLGLVRVILPHLILLIALMAFNFYIFSQPMIHRSQNIL